MTLLFAVLSGCVSVENPHGTEVVSTREQLANARRLFLAPQGAPPVGEDHGELVFQSPLAVRFSCIDKIVLELPPGEAFRELCDLLSRLDRVRHTPEQRVPSLIRYAGERLFGQFVRDPALLDRAFVNFEEQRSLNAKQLSWLLACTAADAGQYQLDGKRVIDTYKTLRESELKLIVLDNIGLCYDPQRVLALLSGELHALPETADMRYPGLIYAARGYRSQLRFEAAARRALATGNLRDDHPLRVRFSGPNDVPDSTGAIAPVLLAAAKTPTLRQRDMFVICTFLRDWARPTLQELADLLIRYDRDEVRYELRKYAQPRRRRSGR